MHNDAKQFVDQKASSAADQRPRETHDAGGMLQFLWERTDDKKWTDAELEWLSHANTSVELMAMNLRKTLQGVAGLVAYEIDHGGSTRAGNFQPHDLPELLYGAADTLGVIEQMSHIGSEADFELRERYRKRAEGKC